MFTIDDNVKVKKSWPLYTTEKIKEFTYIHLVEQARKVARRKKIANWETLEFEFNVDGQLLGYQDFEEYCLNAYDGSCVYITTSIYSHDGRYRKHGTEAMKIKCAMIINGFESCWTWKLYNNGRTYDNLASEARSVACIHKVFNYENIQFIFIIDGKYQVSNEKEFVKYCINAPNPRLIEMETFVNSNTSWMPA